MEWVAEFCRKQYEWADWRSRWGEFDPAASDPHVDAVQRLAGEGPKRILELGPGTGSTAAALAHAGHDVVTIELQPMLADHVTELAGKVEHGSLRSITGDFYEVDPGVRTSSLRAAGSTTAKASRPRAVGRRSRCGGRVARRTS